MAALKLLLKNNKLRLPLINIIDVHKKTLNMKYSLILLNLDAIFYIIYN